MAARLVFHSYSPELAGHLVDITTPTQAAAEIRAESVTG